MSRVMTSGRWEATSAYSGFRGPNTSTLPGVVEALGGVRRDMGR